MTQETLPRFDLYGELEVSPFASVGAIESAYRALVKQHHPDVAAGDDARIKRLNLARDWLTEPELRRRYDQATDRGRKLPPIVRSTTTRSAAAGSGNATAGSRSRSAWGSTPESAEPSFGIHAAEVRQFLAELRSLDQPRAQRVWNGRAVAHTKGYTEALRVAASAARMDRRGEWQFAREAAAVITRGKLGDSTLADQVADVLSDVAGAIAIRDLLSPAEFALVELPWTWRGTIRLPETPPATPAPERPSEPVRLVPVDRPAVAAESKPPGSKPPEPVVDPIPAVPVAAAQVVEAKPVVDAQPVVESKPVVVPKPAVEAKPVLVAPPPISPRPATPFVAAAPPPTKPPSWPTTAPEPRARPPIDSHVTARLFVDRNAVPRAAGESVRPVPVRRAASFTMSATPPRARQPIGRFPMLLVAASVVLLVGSAAVLLLPDRPTQVVAGETDSPTATSGLIAVDSQQPSTGDPATSAAQTDQPVATPGAPTHAGPTPPPGPGPTPRPTRAPGPTPTPAPTAPPTPTPGPTPTPTPTPSPGTSCTVMTLINHWTFNAQHQWAAAGFTGTVLFNPALPPDYKIKWQSLAMGASVPCSSDITVRDAAP